MSVCVLDFVRVMMKPTKMSVGRDDLRMRISGLGPSVVPPIPGPLLSVRGFFSEDQGSRGCPQPATQELPWNGEAACL